jgi:hypothetical protein
LAAYDQLRYAIAHLPVYFTAWWTFRRGIRGIEDNHRFSELSQAFRFVQSVLQRAPHFGSTIDGPIFGIRKLGSSHRVKLVDRKSCWILSQFFD